MRRSIANARSGQTFRRLVEGYYPDPFVFAIVLTFVALAMALGLTDATPVEALVAWGEGLEGLLVFIAQIALTLIATHALANTDAVLTRSFQTASKVLEFDKYQTQFYKEHPELRLQSKLKGKLWLLQQQSTSWWPIGPPGTSKPKKNACGGRAFRSPGRE